MFGIKETLFLDGSQNSSPHFTYAFSMYEVPDSIGGLFLKVINTHLPLSASLMLS